MIRKASNGFGIASLVLGIISIIFCWVPLLGLICAILAIVFYIRQKWILQTGVAIGGLVTGIIGLIFSIFYSLIWLLVLMVIVSPK